MMMTMKTLLLASLVILIFGCSEPKDVKSAVQQQDVQSILDAARAANDLAHQRQHAWTITGKLLADATAALNANDEGTALVAAQRALFTANAAIAQADQEQKVWRDRVPR